MKFIIITHVEHKIEKEKIYGYSPYVQEMNLWLKFVDEVKIIAPVSKKKYNSIEIPYQFKKRIDVYKIPAFDIKTFQNTIKSLFKIPLILYKLFKAMQWADHIHLRCPGNIGLLGCLVQVFFPQKPKTIKYAGNWDPKSKQPFSYRLQKWIVSTPFLTKNAKVLVYGEWPRVSKNSVPFFTASYSEKETDIVQTKDLINTQNKEIMCVFAGALSEGKRPLLSVQTVHQLEQKGYKISLHIYGEGSERNLIENYIEKHQLNNIYLHGNVSKEILKEAFKKAHFLLFFSKSEGWPKVVAEAMFWGCLPITTRVSCVPLMLDEGKRGALVKPEIEEIIKAMTVYFSNPTQYQEHVEAAILWSRQYTTERFEKEIEKLLYPDEVASFFLRQAQDDNSQ